MILRRSFVSLAAAGAFLLLGVTSALAANANESEASRIVASELPPGVTLGAASEDQIITATSKAVRQTPKQTVGIVRAAILSKSPVTRRTTANNTAGDRFKDVIDRSKESGCPPCSFVLGVARAAIRSNSDAASAIIEEASSLCPGCGADLQSLLVDPGLLVGGTEDFLTGPFGFGVGLGPGFPGTVTSRMAGPPSSSILALPPLGVPVTSVVNN